VIRGVIFDCFGVLVHGSLGYLRDITPSRHRKELDDLSRASDRGYVSHEEYLERVAALVNRPSEEIDAITRAQQVRNEKIITLARSLHTDYKVALLSNVGRGVISELFDNQELCTLFDTVVLSSEVGMVKPEASIYELTAANLGLQVGECVMIDDIPINVDGARSIGMEGIVCISTNQLETDLDRLLERNYARATRS
jgi:HAD superfamily hydrolase (TIGR01509 family)